MFLATPFFSNRPRQFLTNRLFKIHFFMNKMTNQGLLFNPLISFYLSLCTPETTFIGQDRVENHKISISGKIGCFSKKSADVSKIRTIDRYHWLFFKSFPVTKPYDQV